MNEPARTNLDDAVYELMHALEAAAHDGPKGHLAVHSVSYWLRYLAYLRIIHYRFEPVSAAWIAAMQEYLKWPMSQVPRALSVEELANRRRMEAFETAAQLEIESFYVFAKILLDRIADTLCLYLGVSRAGWGSSHSKLARKNWLASSCGRLGISAEPLQAVVEGLHMRVVDFRTEVLEHLKDPRRTRGVFPGPNGKLRIHTGSRLNSIPDDSPLRFEANEDLTVLLRDLEKYVAVVVDFMMSNLGRSDLARSSARAPREPGGSEEE